MELSSKVSKQATSSVIPEENSASVHGQDLSYGSLDTHGVCWQEAKSHHKQIRSSSKAMSDAYTDVTVQLAGNTRERKGNRCPTGRSRWHHSNNDEWNIISHSHDGFFSDL